MILPKGQRKQPDDYVHRIYLNHYRGAWIRSGASIFMSMIAFGAYQFEIIKINNLIGNTVAVIFLCLMNPPLILALKKSKSLLFSNIFSFLVNFFEIIGYTAVIYFFGGIKSLWLSPIYAVLINYIGIVGPWWRPLLSASLCWMILALAVALEYFGIIPDQYPAQTPDLPGRSQIAILFALAGLLYVVAFISSYMGALFREKKRRLEEANRELEETSVKLKLAEQELRRSHDELERQVDKRTAELAKTNETLILEIKDRQRAEEALKNSEERYRALFEDNPIEIIVVDKKACITGFNRLESTSGGRLPCLGDVMYKDYAKGHSIDMHQRLLDCITQKKSCDFRDLKHNTKYLDIRMSPLEDGAMITMIDQTDKKRLQDQLLRAQKMEAIGLMAGGIAHDLNNILSGIVTYPDLILMDLEEDSPFRKPIETMQESGIRAAAVVSDLMTIAKGVASRKDALNLNALIKEYLRSVEHRKLIKNHPFVTFKTFIDPDIMNINGSKTHLLKALMNLAANASEAIKGEGTITVTTMNRYLDHPLKGYQDVNMGEYVELTVSDDGTGISPEDLERIFEPFYTKKILGRPGTGLGLSVVWNAVQDHNGYITVTSSEEGTHFKLYFPITRNKVISETEAFCIENYRGDGERVLIVDDEDRQRQIACDLLSKLGYHAEAVPGGYEAVEYIKKQPVDLIVLDMVMPKGINGRETYEAVIKICPGQKAIIASGFAETQEVEEAKRIGVGNYIKKPYTLQKLAAAVKEELSKKKSSP